MPSSDPCMGWIFIQNMPLKSIMHLKFSNNIYFSINTWTLLSNNYKLTSGNGGRIIYA